MDCGRCKQCGAVINPAKEKCEYCGAPLPVTAPTAGPRQSAHRPREPFREGEAERQAAEIRARGDKVRVLVLFSCLALVSLGFLLFRHFLAQQRPGSPRIEQLALPASAAGDASPGEPAPATADERLRAHFKQLAAQICVEGGFSRFGPFAGKIQLTALPDGTIELGLAEMQPRSTAVLRCLRQRFAKGLSFEGRPRQIIYHFSGGRSPDGLRFRDGIELRAAGAER